MSEDAIDLVAPRAIVLLATYNGEAYLRQQLDSIYRQESVNPIVYCRDDGSSDRTIKILREYEVSHGLRLVSDKNVGGSAAKNFRHLVMQVDQSEAEFFFFCDQDDIWLECKMSVAIQRLKAGACLYSSALTPFYSDGRMAKNLKVSITPTRFDHLFQGLSAGCTYAVTQNFFSVIAEMFTDAWFDREDFSHDWLIYTLARTSERKIFHDSKSRILYRQHAANVQGAATGLSGVIYRLKSLQGGWYVGQILKNIEYCRERPYELAVLLAFKDGKWWRLIGKTSELRRSFLEGLVIVLLSTFRIGKQQ